MSEVEPTRDQIRESIAAGLCPWCKSGPFKMVAGHVVRKHDIDSRSLRDAGGFTYTESICDPELSARRVEASRESGVAERMNSGGFNGGGLQKARSKAGAERTRQALANVQRDREQLRAASEKGRPRAIEATKRRARQIRLNAQHGTLQSYKFGCRCAECRSANKAASQAWRDRAKAARTPTPAHESPDQ